jgi:acetyl esterase/lipase
MKLYITSQNHVELRWIDQKKRDIVLICPGGGYQRTSPREGIPVAKVYEQRGFHTAIYHYRETLLTHPYLAEEGKLFLEKLTNMNLVNRVFILGFSAGGHFACQLSELYPTLIAGSILAYPVITSDHRYAHQDSIFRLMGGNLSLENLDIFSLEKHVHSSMKPIFVWHTMDDVVVPVENTLLLVHACHQANVKVECHLYPQGRHGLSLGNRETSFEDMDPLAFEEENQDVSSWAELSLTFLEGIKS